MLKKFTHSLYSLILGATLINTFAFSEYKEHSRGAMRTRTETEVATNQNFPEAPLIAAGQAEDAADFATTQLSPERAKRREERRRRRAEREQQNALRKNSQ